MSNDKPDTHKRKKFPSELYERELYVLQEELVKMEQWVADTGARIVVVFEGRDAAGKGGTIKRITEHLNPRVTKHVALPKPTERETTQWYFQRYIAHLPAAGEVVLFDRSWYNRAGVEHVLGFCTQQDYYRFLRQTPIFERLLVEEGIILIKYWFSVSDDEQERRFQKRVNDPLRRWKLSETDLFSRTRWVDYSRAKDEMFIHTDIPEAPWFVVEADDKKVARLNTIAHLLSKIPYEARSIPEIALPPRQEDAGYVRPPKELSTQVPDFAAEVLARHALVAPPGHDPSQGFEDDTK
jgi:polyphosphate kinase 2